MASNTTTIVSSKVAGCIHVNSPYPRSPAKSSRSPRTSLRKAPCCKQCQRPRSGHPRSGCPYVDPPIPPSEAEPQGERKTLMDSFKALQIDCSADEKRKSPPYSPGDFVFEGDIQAIVSPVLSASHGLKSDELEIIPGLAESNGIATRPVTPDQGSNVRSLPLGRTMSQQQQQSFLDRVRMTLEGSVVILKHALDGLPDILAEAQEMALTAEVIGSVDEATRLVAFGRDKALVKRIGIVGSSDKEAVNKACENEVRKGRFPALVAVGGASALAGAVATWTGLAFS